MARPVDSMDDPLEEAFKGGLGDGLDGELDLLLGLGLGHVVTTHLDPRTKEGLKNNTKSGPYSCKISGRTS